MKKVLSYMLAAMVFIFTVIAILAIWEVVMIEDVLWKSLKTLIVLHDCPLTYQTGCKALFNNGLNRSTV